MTAERPSYDSLFTLPPGATDNSELRFARDSWDLYATGYKQAADILVNYVTETEHHIDTVLYPAAFLYRHYVELRCKWIIRHGSRLIDRPKKTMWTHSFKALWGEAREVICGVWDDASTSDSLARLDKVLDELAALDPSSFSFRYPEDKAEKDALPPLRYLNLGVIQAVMGEVSNELEGICIGISHYLDLKAEQLEIDRKIEAEMAAEWEQDMREHNGGE